MQCKWRKTQREKDTERVGKQEQTQKRVVEWIKDGT